MEKQQYNFDERLDYLAYMLNERTKGKAYENFIVNAIYSRVCNPELIPVTQQYVKSSNSKGEYYLLDLYFPQLNYGIEIDEMPHSNATHRYADLVRAEDINATIRCKEYRIPIYKKDSSKNRIVKRTIDEIEKDIELVVSIIKKRIARKKGGIKWETNEQKKKTIIQCGIFSDADDVDYKGITEIYNLCGGKRHGPNKGEAAKALRSCYVTLNDEYKLWVPKLAIILSDGSVKNTANGYENYLSDNHKWLYEIQVGKKKKWTEKDKEKKKKYKNVVFMQMRDRFGKRCVKFLGVYQCSCFTRVGSDNCAIYKRIAREVEIDALKEGV